MEIAFERDMATLKNPGAGFVARRDAAKRLGDGARRAWHALNEHLEDRDAYVRAAVEVALKGAPDGQVLGKFLEAGGTPQDLRSLAQACSNGEAVEAQGEGYVVTFKLASGRRQRVYLSAYTDRDGHALIRVYTYCGKATPEAMTWVLRSNAKLTRCAFALHRRKQEDYLILIYNLAAEDATASLVQRTVEEIATHGDWLESKLSGMDEF